MIASDNGSTPVVTVALADYSESKKKNKYIKSNKPAYRTFWDTIREQDAMQTLVYRPKGMKEN